MKQARNEEVGNIESITINYEEMFFPCKSQSYDQHPQSAMNSLDEMSSIRSTNVPPLALKAISSSVEPRQHIRTRMIIIGAVIILSIVIIVILATMLGILLHSPTTESKTNPSTISGDVNSYSDTTVDSSAPIIYDVGNGGISGDPPCSSHTVINDPSRNIATSGIGRACDDGPLFNTSIAGRWIRFLGSGGTIIPLTSPGMNHCSAFLSGWFNGTLPLIVGEIVNSTVCFDIYAFNSEITVSVSVINCVNFHVYFLPPVLVCNARYCTV